MQEINSAVSRKELHFFWSEKYCSLDMWLEMSKTLCDRSEGWELGAQRCAGEKLWKSISLAIIREWIMRDSLSSTAGVTYQRSPKNREHERRNPFLAVQEEFWTSAVCAFVFWISTIGCV